MHHSKVHLSLNDVWGQKKDPYEQRLVINKETNRCFLCSNDGIGRHNGLKIRGCNMHVGSNPITPTYN